MDYSADQQALEKRMAELGVQRYRAKQSKAREKKRETTTGAGRYLLREALSVYTTALEDWLKKARKTGGRHHGSAKYIELLPADLVAFIVTKLVLDNIGTKQSLIATASAVAGALEDELRFRKLRQEHKGIFKEVEKKTRLSGTKHKRKALKGAARHKVTDVERWPRRAALQVGVMLIELLRISTELVEVLQVYNGTKRIAVLSATEQTLTWLEKAHAAHEVLLPFYMPCVQKPKDWGGTFGGGYHTDELVRRPLIKSMDRQYLTETQDADLSEVCDAVNALQNTAWEINTDVLAVVEHCWEKNISIAELPSRDADPIPPKPDDIATNEESRKAWRSAASETFRRNVAARSARLQLAKILFMARTYTGLRFFYPYQADFRGRLYCVPYFLQPQGPSIARGLLRFADGKPIGDERGARWLAIHGANSYGVDKVSMDARRQWVAKNEPLILETAADPYHSRWWSLASKPWEFLAFCYEWAAFRKQGYGFVSSLPVSMDGSNNGLQVFSLLLRDPVGAAATNCTPHDVPRDIYQDVADRVTEKLHASDHPYAKKWLEAVNGRVPRACCKRPVMTLPYGSTTFSCRKYVDEWYREHARKTKNDPFEGKFFDPCRWLATLVWDSISETVVAAKKCMAWLQSVAQLCCDHKLAIRWMSPSGFPVKQFYRLSDLTRIKTTVGEQIRWTQARVERDAMSRRRQVNGISPNYIHSLDAAALVKTVNQATSKGVTSFAMIHDSFGTTAADAESLAVCLRDAYAQMFSTDLLAEFREQVQLQLGDRGTVPPVPQSGDLDVNEVRNSVYFFA